jgi:hypothetical protein
VTIINGQDVSKHLIGCREVETGQAVWIPSTDGRTPEQEIFLEELRESVVGKRFLAKYDLIQNFPAISETMDKLYPERPYVSTGIMLDSMKVLMIAASDKLVPREVVPAVAPPATPAAVDKNGRPLTDSQKAWSEYRTFSETHSMKEVRDRMRVDPGYASFVNTNREREMNVPIDGDVRPFNTHLLPKKELSSDAVRGIAAKASLLLPDLKKWVIEYHKTPAARVRALRSPGSNPMGFEAYNQAFDAACAANLI